MNSCKLKEFNHGQILIHREFIIHIYSTMYVDLPVVKWNWNVQYI